MSISISAESIEFDPSVGLSAERFESIGSGAERSESDATYLVTIPEVSERSRRLARTLDVAGAASLLILLAPASMIAALAVRVSSRGPVIFRQQRVGRDGVHFTVLKFRTMVDGTHEQVLANPETRRLYENNDFKLLSGDARITRVGRLLRKTSLDELPQLINVLRGHMSLVGIRPLLPQEVAMRSTYDQYLYRLLKPGMTGLWQVEGRSRIGDAHRIDLDRRFVQEWNAASAVRILFRTPKAVLLGAGAH